MLKALLKKQLLELASFYFRDKKTGKLRTGKGMVGYILLFAVVFVSIGFTFFGISSILCGPLVAAGMGWLFFALLGTMSILLGTFGSVFNTYAGLYKAKDNDLLLSMPIPPAYVLLSRVLGSYVMSLVFSAIVWIPALAAYIFAGGAGGLSILFGVLLLFVNALFITVLTCALGWVIALISARIGKKNYITVILSLLFIVVYYTICFRLNSLLPLLISNSEAIGAGIRAWVFPLYQMGRAACGELLPMLLCTGMTLALAALCGYVLSRSFVKLVTSNRGEKKAEYRESPIKARGLRAALLGRELKRFTSSAVYMLNCGLGIALLPAAVIFAAIKLGDIRANLLPQLAGSPLLTMLPTLLTAVVCLFLSLNGISAPSVSLEGKSIWLIHSLPVEPRDVLWAKAQLHFRLNILPGVICGVALGLLLDCGILTALCIGVAVAAYVAFSAAFGLMLNLKKPNLDWTSETVPVKQGIPVLLNMLGGWLLSVALGGAYYFLRELMGPELYLLAFAVLFLLGERLLSRWLRTRGAEIFAQL